MMNIPNIVKFARDFLLDRSIMEWTCNYDGAPMSIQGTYEAAYLQDIGGRSEQQDRVAILWSDAACLVVPADGMGGHIRGAFAAQSVIDAASNPFEEDAQVPAADLLKIAVETAHNLINTGAKSLQFPGSTCVMLHLTMSQATWTNIGDSRLYRFRDGQYLDRTVDHTDVDLARLEGLLSEEEARADPRRNRLFGYLGGLQWPQIEVKSADISERDSFLLCSDGLWENVDTQELEAVFAAKKLSRTLRELVSAARSRGGAKCDNISVAAVRQAR